MLFRSFVAKLARQPGARESRYAQLFTGPAAAEPEVGAAAEAVDDAGLVLRLERLEAAVAALGREVEALKSGR